MQAIYNKALGLCVSHLLGELCAFLDISPIASLGTILPYRKEGKKNHLTAPGSIIFSQGELYMYDSIIPQCLVSKCLAYKLKISIILIQILCAFVVN